MQHGGAACEPEDEWSSSLVLELAEAQESVRTDTQELWAAVGKLTEKHTVPQVSRPFRDDQTNFKECDSRSSLTDP
jgi:hypothetical protein